MRTPDPIAMRKLDARLIKMIQARRDSSSANDRVAAAVMFTGDLAALRAAGFAAPSMVHHPINNVNIAAGSIAIGLLVDLAALKQVLSVEAGYRMKPEIDESVPEIGAKALHEGTGFLLPLKGAGVVVGIIDLGFDVRHRNFRKADGKTRVLALWDQTIGPLISGPTPQNHLEPPEASPSVPFGYGVEYLSEWIDSTLGEGPPLGPFRTTDKSNHGTPVTDIAAGNGLQPGNCHFAGHFVGVAPEADLILVKIRSTKNIQNSNEVQHAFEYIFTHPLVLSRPIVPPVVVNFSQGDNLGPHDGSSALEQAIDALLLSRPGRMVVKSAGNEAATSRHAEVPIPLGPPTDLRLRVGPDDSAFRVIEVWYPAAARIAVRVVALGRQSDEVAPGSALAQFFVVNPTVPEDEQTNVNIQSVLNHPRNGRNVITISIGTNSTIPADTWIVRFRNVGSSPTTAQVWLDNDGDKETHFISHVSSARTITTPGTAQQVITVGAFDSKGRKGKLGAFSSHGPIDPGPGGAIRTAPDLTAPGVGITSAKNGDHETSCCECCVTAYKGEKDNTGTSVAAPHVAGVIALMLERNPEMTVDTVRQILRETADRPSEFTGPRGDEELNTWGFGRVNAVAAVEHVPPFFGDAGPLPLHHGEGDPSSRTLFHGGDVVSQTREGCQVLDGFVPFLPVIMALRRNVLSSSEGQLCAALVSRYFSEARGLIRSNRRVAVAWHRAGGPTFLRYLVRALIARETNGGAPTMALPDPPTGFESFFAMLARYGSADLRADLDQYGIAFGTLIRLALDRLQTHESEA